MLNILLLAALIVAVVFLIWLCIRTWRQKNILVKWFGTGLAALLTAAFTLVSLVMITGLVKLHARSAPTPDLKVAGTPEQIERGRAIADTFCTGCHTKDPKDPPLTGGKDLGDDLPMRLGAFVTPNLTPAADLSHWSDGQIFRAIRNGIDAGGHWLMIMSYTNAGKLSDEDTHSLIAYLRSLPAAGHKTMDPPDQLNPLGLLMLGAGMLPSGKPIQTGVVTAPLKGPTVAYGEYILSYQDCRECHGADLTGGVAGQLAPIGPGLSIVKQWKLEEFMSTMRTGVDPTGHQIADIMPWRPIGRMDDQELTAIYGYLTQLPD